MTSVAESRRAGLEADTYRVQKDDVTWRARVSSLPVSKGWANGHKKANEGVSAKPKKVPQANRGASIELRQWIRACARITAPFGLRKPGEIIHHAERKRKRTGPRRASFSRNKRAGQRKTQEGQRDNTATSSRGHGQSSPIPGPAGQREVTEFEEDNRRRGELAPATLRPCIRKRFGLSPEHRRANREHQARRYSLLDGALAKRGRASRRRGSFATVRSAEEAPESYFTPILMPPALMTRAAAAASCCRRMPDGPRAPAQRVLGPAPGSPSRHRDRAGSRFPPPGASRAEVRQLMPRNHRRSRHVKVRDREARTAGNDGSLSKNRTNRKRVAKTARPPAWLKESRLPRRADRCPLPVQTRMDGSGMAALGKSFPLGEGGVARVARCRQSLLRTVAGRARGGAGRDGVRGSSTHCTAAAARSLHGGGDGNAGGSPLLLDGANILIRRPIWPEGPALSLSRSLPHLPPCIQTRGQPHRVVPKPASKDVVPCACRPRSPRPACGPAWRQAHLRARA
ncbi:hypothetical protein HPB48_001165 [Haemaphysalis longicornis]|uniref:Uncharacterized protein n=1 Tax=Haemaphysalis longicornis TaxID=44386 RepID=A0A9J6FI53_HAELO|nr:hypothetical protein HPB48_001165 [Haemaphysalis longicornis]